MDWTHGASMPVVFLTAIYALLHIGHLEKGQTVLIHSGCGGVGLAAIQIAQMVGAEVYTTVGSEAKASYLTESLGIPRNHIFSSRSDLFRDEIRRETGDRGVDLALNSLSGELLHATWRCVAKWGTMVEIGKVDLLGAGKLDMDVFLGNRSYCQFDLAQLIAERPHRIGSLLDSMLEYHKQGFIQPIQIAQVPQGPKREDEYQDALRYMQQGTHIGKIVMPIPSMDTILEQLGRVPPSADKALAKLDPSASYLLVGGLGGLGRSVAIWMVQHGARNLTFLSRSIATTSSCGTTDSSKEGDFVRMLGSMSCDVQLVRGSVTSAADVVRAVDESPRPVRGMIHMAMVLRDQAFQQMGFGDWTEVMAPKVTGAWNLHTISREKELDLDFFVLFSSLSGVLGQPGQAPYSAANAYLDAFVRYRTGMGLPCTSLDLGAMEGVGYLSEHEGLLDKMRGTGWSPVREEQLLEALDAVLARRHGGATACKKELDISNNTLESYVDTNAVLIGIAPDSSNDGDSGSTRLHRDVRLSAFLSKGRGSGSEASSNSNNSLRRLLAEARDNPTLLGMSETADLLAREIGIKLFSLILKPDQEPNIALGLAELGLDSLVAVELRAWCKAMFTVEISVLEMLAMGTLGALGKTMAARLANKYGQ
ncbi:polyketide synthase [Apiospora phragmitis]|uniref:Polyketide synthase n=1 Tax=Apiospora phragmitis TaxID=2905665 RepID=A0ABR1VSE2_9PEZI